jgi:hypothetical protein
MSYFPGQETEQEKVDGQYRQGDFVSENQPANREAQARKQ